MSRSIEVQVSDQHLVLDVASVHRCIAALDESSSFHVPDGSLGVSFVNPDECSRLHGTFFNDSDLTDVMTFPGDAEDHHAGDIAICPQIASQACHENGLSFQVELTLYLVHAWLHLAGLDDRTPDTRRVMRDAESLMMELLERESAQLSGLWSS